MQLSIDKEKCIGCGACVGLDSEIFAIGADGKAEVIMSEISEEKQSIAIEAINGCPQGAISEAGSAEEAVVSEGSEEAGLADPISEEPVVEEATDATETIEE